MAYMPDDTEGRLIGWSLGSGMDKRRIHDLVQFPCEFLFKAVGRSTHSFVSNLLDRVGIVIGRAVTPDEHSVRKSAQGTYESVTLRLWVTSGDEVYSIYEAIGADEGVKYLL